MEDSIIVRKASEEDSRYAEEISLETEASAIVRCSGISKRTPESIIKKIREGNAVIAVTDDKNEQVFLTSRNGLTVNLYRTQD